MTFSIFHLENASKQLNNCISIVKKSRPVSIFTFTLGGAVLVVSQPHILVSHMVHLQLLSQLEVGTSQIDIVSASVPKV